jgi:hypothetical protein
MFTSCSFNRPFLQPYVEIANCVTKCVPCDKAVDSKTGGVFSVRSVPEDELKIRLSDNSKGSRHIGEKGYYYYLLDSSGFKPGDRYEFYRVNHYGEFSFPINCIATADGSLYMLNDNIDLSCKLLSFNPDRPGEHFVYVLKNCKTKELLCLTVKPEPVGYTWEDGAMVDLSFFDFNEANVLMLGGDFKPFEKIVIIYYGIRGVFDHDIICNSRGRFSMDFSLDDLAYNGGERTVMILRKDQPAVRIKFPWGNKAEEKTLN